MLKKISEKFWDIWEDPESMGQKVVRAGFINFFQKGIIRFARLIRTIIIARLLFPNDIGLFGLATLVMATIDVLIQPGFNSAIIQEKGDVKKYLDSAWTYNILKNIFLFVFLFFVGAPLSGQFFGNEQVVLITQVISFVFLISAFENIGITLLEREIKFNKLFFYYVLGTLAQIAAVIIAAFFLRNVWALVIGLFVGKTAYMILSYIYHPYRPRLNFNISGARHLFVFGKWIWLTGIVIFLAGKGDALVLGRLLKPSDLAFYQMALVLGTLPAVEFASSISGILFPLYSRIQKDIAKMKKVFVRVSGMIYAIIVPASVGLFIMAREIIKYVYGDRWLPMEPILYVAIFYGIIKSFESLVNPLLLGMGKPQATLFTSIVRVAVMFSIIIPLTQSKGAVGTAWALLIGLFVSQVILFFRVRKELQMSLRSILREVYLPVLASLIMYIAIIGIKALLPINSILMLLLYIAYGAGIYMASIWYLDKVRGGKLYSSFLWIKRNT